MSTHRPSLTTEFDSCTDRLDCLLKERCGVSFRTYKTILATVKLVAVIVCGGAIVVAPENTHLALLVLGAIVVGPDFIEARLSDSTGGK